VGVLVEVEARFYGTVLRALDSLEGYRPTDPNESFYHRARRLVTLTSGEQRVAWVYLGRQALVAGLHPIASGHWKAYCMDKQAEVAGWWAAGGRVPAPPSTPV
jgi:gamma-glutamylcyclotransferase (GGCT)/AIG2-like uncharacterized protein YtfP